jgi:hypothetical protein
MKKVKDCRYRYRISQKKCAGSGDEIWKIYPGSGIRKIHPESWIQEKYALNPGYGKLSLVYNR